ncbi:MAG: tetratricopeptide repeat protein [Spirochaetes bacterium]|nr:tetratricopeptide repeat protein [Spirochaetota bacterium]
MIGREQFVSLLNEGVKQLRDDDYTGAIDKFETIYKHDRTNTEAGYYLAVAYANEREYDKAIEVFDEIIVKLDNPLRLMQSHFLLGYIYAVREMFELAELEFKEVLKLGIVNAQVHAALGYVYHRRKDYALAVSHLKKALTIDPSNANAHNSLGFVMAEAGGDIDEAIKEIRDALDLAPENPAYFDSLGWAYHKKGDSINAKRYLMKAFELAPYHDEIKEHLRIVRQVSL